MAIRVLVVDDQRFMRDAVSSLLESVPDIEVMGYVENGRDALRFMEEMEPDVIVMDLMMPDMNGVEATLRVSSLYPDCKVLIFTGHLDNRLIHETLKAGAKGFALKSCTSAEELVSAIRAVADNGNYFSKEITEIILNGFIHHRPEEMVAPYSQLSSREREVLQLIAEGKNAKEIAFDLDVSFKTINVHRQNIMKKLKLGSVAELTRYAVRERIVE